MNIIMKYLLATTLMFCATASLLAQAAPPASKSTATREKKPAIVHADPAERVFQANCNRCHAAPEGLSSRITGAVVRHMRVRANLSAEEERMILSYLNP